MSFTRKYINQSIEICNQIDTEVIENIANELSLLRDRGGRLFFIGSGGGAGHASHAVNDFRKITNIEAYTPTDNVSELTARINDDGWDSSYVNWLKVSKFSSVDAVFVFSVGGGNVQRKISLNIVNAIKFAKKKKSKVLSIVGKKNGFAYKNSDYSLFIPVNKQNLLTPITESFQCIIWHLLVSHPKLQKKKTTW